jgi:pilus assembly protein Flp/PilA
MIQDANKLLRTFAADESGTTAIEYGIIAAGIAAVVVGAVNTVGVNLKTGFYDVVIAAMNTLP